MDTAGLRYPAHLPEVQAHELGHPITEKRTPPGEDGAAFIATMEDQIIMATHNHTPTSTLSATPGALADEIESAREAVRTAWRHYLAQDWPDEAEHEFRRWQAERAALAYCRVAGLLP